MNLQVKKKQMLDAIELIDKAVQYSEDIENSARVKQLEKSAMILIEEIGRNEFFESDYQTIINQLNEFVKTIENGTDAQVLAKIGVLCSESKVILGEINRRNGN